AFSVRVKRTARGGERFLAGLSADPRRRSQGKPRMVFFKQMKDMKDMVNAAPGLVEQAQQMGAQAQQMAAAQQAAAQARMAQYGGGQPGAFGQQAAPAGPDFEPIDGVTLEQVAPVGKE